MSFKQIKNAVLFGIPNEEETPTDSSDSDNENVQEIVRPKTQTWIRLSTKPWIISHIKEIFGLTDSEFNSISTSPTDEFSTLNLNSKYLEAKQIELNGVKIRVKKGKLLIGDVQEEEEEEKPEPPKPPKIIVNKVDQDGNPLSGAKMDMFKDEIPRTNPIWSIDGDATVEIPTDKLEVPQVGMLSKYVLVESETPEDYEPADEVKFEIDSNGVGYCNGESSVESGTLNISIQNIKKQIPIEPEEPEPEEPEKIWTPNLNGIATIDMSGVEMSPKYPDISGYHLPNIQMESLNVFFMSDRLANVELPTDEFGNPMGEETWTTRDRILSELMYYEDTEFVDTIRQFGQDYWTPEYDSYDWTTFSNSAWITYAFSDENSKMDELFNSMSGDAQYVRQVEQTRQHKNQEDIITDMLNDGKSKQQIELGLDEYKNTFSKCMSSYNGSKLLLTTRVKLKANQEQIEYATPVINSIISDLLQKKLNRLQNFYFEGMY